MSATPSPITEGPDRTFHVAEHEGRQHATDRRGTVVMFQDVLEMLVNSVDKKHEAKHQNVRNECDRLGATLLDVEQRMRKLQEVAGQKPDVTTLNYPPRIVLTLILIAFALGGGQWAAGWSFTYGMRDSLEKTQSDVRDIRTKMEKQTEIDALKSKVDEANGKASLLQQVQLADKVNGMEKQINEIANTVRRR